MGYVYEDEENEIVTEEKKEDKKKKHHKSNKSNNKEFIVDNLMTASPEEEKQTNSDESYTVNNLLDSEESNDVYLQDLLNKKDMKLFNAYLGANSKKITDKNFNFAALIFGGSYLIYRKVYGIGLFVLFICLIVQVIFPIAKVAWYVTLIFELLAHIACGIFANQLILNNAASKILNLKMSGSSDIKTKLVRLGGTNMLLFFCAFILSSGITSVLVYKEAEHIISSFESEPTFIKYDGQIKANESVNIRTLLDIEAPEGYRTGHANVYQYSFLYTKDANIAIDIVMASRYESASSLINDIVEYENLDTSSIEEISLSNATWHYVSTPLSFYAVGVINNNMYFVRQMHRGNENAYIDYKAFLESIKVHEETTLE